MSAVLVRTSRASLNLLFSLNDIYKRFQTSLTVPPAPRSQRMVFKLDAVDPGLPVSELTPQKGGIQRAHVSTLPLPRGRTLNPTPHSCGRLQGAVRLSREAVLERGSNQAHDWRITCRVIRSFMFVPSRSSKSKKKWRGIFLDFVNLITTMPSRHSGHQVYNVDIFPIAR